jgi:hypothetical protein
MGVEADQLEDAINAARLSLDQEIGVWSVYGDHGFRPAQHVLAAIKEAKSPMLMRQKAAPAGVDDSDARVTLCSLTRRWSGYSSISSQGKDAAMPQTTYA